MLRCDACVQGFGEAVDFDVGCDGREMGWGDGGVVVENGEFDLVSVGHG